MRDPYDVLGVQKNASAATIKSAFRKLAKKLHPDANKNDKKAAANFAELNAAYEIVGDEDKRKAFDRGEIDAEGKPRFQGFPGGGFGRGAAWRSVGQRRWPARRQPFRKLHLGAGRLPAPRRQSRFGWSRRGRRWRFRRHSEGDVRRQGRRGRGNARPTAHAVRAG